MWYSNLLRVEILEHIYGDIPELIGVFIKSIKIDNDEKKAFTQFAAINDVEVWSV